MPFWAGVGATLRMGCDSGVCKRDVQEKEKLVRSGDQRRKQGRRRYGWWSLAHPEREDLERPDSV